MSRFSTYKWLTACAAVLMGGLAQAAPIVYTFTGTGSGTVGGNTFTGATFVFTFVGNTTNITSGGGEFFQTNIGGTFSEGSVSETLKTDNLIVDNNDVSFPRLGFFNSTIDNGFTLQNAAFATYGLNTNIGPITGTGANLLPTLSASGVFDTVGGDTIRITAVTSGTVTATLTPEPATSEFLLLGAFLLTGMAAARSKKAHGRSETDDE